MCQVCSWSRAAWRGFHHSARATQTQGMMLSRPLVVFETPKPLTTVGSQ